MARYATLGDCVDPALVVTDSHLNDADVFVELSLRQLGLTSDDIAHLALPNAILTTIAVAWAKQQAAIEGAMGESSPLLDKARQYERTATLLVSKLTREALGLTAPAGSGFGQITLGRG